MAELDEDRAFDEALDECCRRVRSGEPLERCLPSYPDTYQAELRRLVPLSLTLGKIGQDPTPAFTERLEGQLAQLAVKERRRSPSGVSGLLSRLARAITARRTFGVLAALLLLAIIGGFSVVSAAQKALPDSPLYPVQLLNAKVQVGLAPNKAAQIAVRERQVVTLGRQLRVAQQSGKPPAVSRAITLRMGQMINQMVSEAIAERENGDPEPAGQVAQLLQALQQQLEAAAPQAPPRERPLLIRLHGFVVRQEQRLSGQPDAQPAPSAGELASPPTTH